MTKTQYYFLDDLIHRQLLNLPSKETDLDLSNTSDSLNDVAASISESPITTEFVENDCQLRSTGLDTQLPSLFSDNCIVDDKEAFLNDVDFVSTETKTCLSNSFALPSMLLLDEGDILLESADFSSHSKKCSIDENVIEKSQEEQSQEKLTQDNIYQEELICEGIGSEQNYQNLQDSLNSNDSYGLAVEPQRYSIEKYAELRAYDEEDFDNDEFFIGVEAAISSFDHACKEFEEVSESLPRRRESMTLVDWAASEKLPSQTSLLGSDISITRNSGKDLSNCSSKSDIHSNNDKLEYERKRLFHRNITRSNSIQEKSPLWHGPEDGKKNWKSLPELPHALILTAPKQSKKDSTMKSKISHLHSSLTNDFRKRSTSEYNDLPNALSLSRSPVITTKGIPIKRRNYGTKDDLDIDSHKKKQTNLPRISPLRHSFNIGKRPAASTGRNDLSSMSIQFIRVCLMLPLE